MTQAGSLLAIALVGLTLVPGAALADVLPPLPPMPTMPAFPGTPTLPSPNLPLGFDRCVAVLNELGGSTSIALTEARDGTVQAFAHQNVEAQALIEASEGALALEELAVQVVELYGASYTAVNYTLLDSARAINFTRDGLAPAIDRSLNGTANTTNGIATSSARAGNDTLNWGQATFRRDWATVAPLVNATYTGVLARNPAVINGISDWVTFVRNGDAAPLESFYDSMADAQANASDAAVGIYMVPSVAAEASDMALASANGYVQTIAELVVSPTPPDQVLDGFEAPAARMGTAAQEDLGALQGSISEYGGVASGWALAIPSRAPGCARVGS